MITTAAVNSVVWTMVCLSALKTVPVSCVKTGCQKLGQHKPRLQHREIAARLLPRRKQWGRKLRWWTTWWNYTHQGTLFLPSVPSPRIRPRPSGRRQSQVHRNPSPWLPASRRWNGPAPTGRTTAGRGRLNASEDTAKKNVTSLRGISRHAVTATAATGERARARPSSSGGASSRRCAESGSVSKASDTRPSSSSSRHHQHHSSGDRRSLSSSASRASPDRKSQPSHREKRRESSDRTGGTFVARRDVQLSPAKSKAPEKRTITVVASPARQIHIELAPAVPVPAPVADGSAGAGPAASGGSATSDGPAARNDTVTGNDPTTDHGSATGNSPATGDGSATGNGPATGDGSATGNGSATGDGPVTVDGPTTVVDLYAFPPFKMVLQVLQKIAQSPGVQVILIAQMQPAASWFPELLDLAQEDPVPYCFWRSSVKFQGHTALKSIAFDPDWAFPDSNSSLNSPMATKWCTKLEVA